LTLLVERQEWHSVPINSIVFLEGGPGQTCVKVKVKVGFLYSATYTANQNSALYNLGTGSWLARASGAAALCGLFIARTNGHWTHDAASKHTTAPINHTRPSLCKHSPDGATPSEVADIRLLLTTHLLTSNGWKA